MESAVGESRSLQLNTIQFQTCRDAEEPHMAQACPRDALQPLIRAFLVKSHLHMHKVIRTSRCSPKKQFSICTSSEHSSPRLGEALSAEATRIYE